MMKSALRGASIATSLWSVFLYTSGAINHVDGVRMSVIALLLVLLSVLRYE